MSKAKEDPSAGILEELKQAEQGLGIDYFNALELDWVPTGYILHLSKEEYAVLKNILIRFLRPLDDLKVDAEFRVWEECSEPYSRKSTDKWPYEQAKAVLDRLVVQSYRIGE